MTGGGPAYASEVIGTLLYRKSFVENFMGYGAALATVLTVIVVTVFLISRMMQAKRERA
jgi:multiple sugar transport system permease protein